LSAETNYFSIAANGACRGDSASGGGIMDGNRQGGGRQTSISPTFGPFDINMHSVATQDIASSPRIHPSFSTSVFQSRKESSQHVNDPPGDVRQHFAAGGVLDGDAEGKRGGGEDTEHCAARDMRAIAPKMRSSVGAERAMPSVPGSITYLTNIDERVYLLID